MNNTQWIATYLEAQAAEFGASNNTQMAYDPSRLIVTLLCLVGESTLGGRPPVLLMT